jgi:hypothetical protein
MTGRAEGFPAYTHLGTPIDHNKAKFLYNFGILNLLTSMWIQKRLPLVNWDNVTLKMAALEAQEVLKNHREYAELHQTLRATWHSSNVLTYMLLSLFFARYPHRNGVACENEVDSFYDQNFRGQGQVDLWMMGEGAHHMHHAKSDVSYALLPKICADVEANHPDLKLSSRGNDDLKSLEYTHEMPPKLVESDEQSMQFPWERTLAIRAGKDMMSSDPASAVAKIAEAVLTSALHCCTTADRALLTKIHKDMKLPGKRQPKGHPVPIAEWPQTVLSDRTVELLLAKSDHITAEVTTVAKNVGAKMPKLHSDADIKGKYLEFFVALADTMVSPEQQQLFAELYS